MTIEINGMADVILTVSRFEVAREFYRKLLPEFGMKPVFDGDKLFYCAGARTAIGSPATRRPPPKCGALRRRPRGSLLRQTPPRRKGDSNPRSHCEQNGHARAPAGTVASRGKHLS
jgi:hypothetical protein